LYDIIRAIHTKVFFEEHEEFLLTYFKREDTVVMNQLFAPSLDEGSTGADEDNDE
jgi:hypothetical protein